jgi:aubergine
MYQSYLSELKNSLTNYLIFNGTLTYNFNFSAVPTQVITKRSMTNKNALSIATKISIQMNCKVGGAPWTCVNPIKRVMVCGYDVTHDTMNKGSSFGGFVATLNDNFSRYFSTVFAHPNGSDISNSMANALERALVKFQKYNEGSLPTRIVFYRDGVGDGQIAFVLNNEVEAIKVCSNIKFKCLWNYF